jgi:DNA-binding NarL/FixJ family response regulator
MTPGIVAAVAARSLEEASMTMQTVRPDVVVVDVASNAGLVVARRLAEEAEHVPIVGAGLADTDRAVVAAAEAGLDGFVSAEADIDTLVASVRSAARGELLCSPRAAAIMRRHITAIGREYLRSDAGRLTTREREVMILVDKGLSNREVARQLHIEVSTVKNHIRNVFEKLDVRDREAAAARLRRSDLVLGPKTRPAREARALGS